VVAPIQNYIRLTSICRSFILELLAYLFLVRFQLAHHAVLEKLLILIQFPGMPALPHSPHHARAHHPRHHLRLVIVGSHAVNSSVEAALGAGHFNHGHGGVEDVGLVRHVLLGA
jgi:hypothetical protein